MNALPMNVTRFLRVLAVAGFLFGSAATQAQGGIRYEAQPGSKVKIDGVSTIHDWTVEGQIIGGFMEWESNFPLDPAQGAVPDLKVTPKVEVTIPIRSLKSGKSLMDKVMAEHMKATEFPKITYTLKEMKLRDGATHKAGAPLQFDTKGELTVSGVTKAISMVVNIEKAEGGLLKATGSIPSKMTDFKIEPPAPKIALGAIKTADDVKLSFEWLTKKAEKAP